MHHCILQRGEQIGHGCSKEEAMFIPLWAWRELRVTHTASWEPEWLGGVCFCPTACSCLWQRNTRRQLFVYCKYYGGGPTACVAFTSNLHVSEKAPHQCLMHLCKMLALVWAKLWNVFQHCSPLVKQENHITFTFLLHIQHPGKEASQSQQVSGVSLFN